MRVASAAIGGIGASLGALVALLAVGLFLIMMVFPLPGGSGGSAAYLWLVLATQGAALACYLAAMVGAGLPLWERHLAGLALMLGGALGALGSGIAYVRFLPRTTAPLEPVYPEWPAYAIYLFPVCLLLIGAILAYLARGANP